MRHLAFVDVETTGLDPDRHEIIEIAVLRVDPHTLAELDAVAVQVRPMRPADADPAALALVGYSPDAWADAVGLDEALALVKPLLDGVMLAGHNVAFDRAFLDVAWREAGSTPDAVDHHLLDTATLAWPLWTEGSVESLSLAPVCVALGIEREREHRALADARASLEVARRLLPDRTDAALTGTLAGDERAILRTQLRRVHAGRTSYGPWDTSDGRSYPREALLEVLDALNYCAAELVRLDRADRHGGVRTRRIYVCHPFAGDPDRNADRVRTICRALTESGFVPLAPHLYLPQFLDEATERETALRLCLELVASCDEVRVYGGPISAGMRQEIARAEALGVPVRIVDGDAP